MADLTKKTKFVNIVVRKKDLLISERDKYILKFCKDFCEYYAYIYHKHDKNEFGEIEDEHLHLVATLKTSQRLSTTLNEFVDCLSINTTGVMIDKCNSYEGSMQYLIHKNDSEKTQHNIDEVVTNYDAKEFNIIMTTEVTSLTPQRLRALVVNSKSNYDLVEALGINRYSQLRKVIADIKEDLRIQREREERKKLKEKFSPPKDIIESAV